MFFQVPIMLDIIRHDDDKLGVAVVIIPNSSKDIHYCEKIADIIATYV
jgi:hypothetical protein